MTDAKDIPERRPQTSADQESPLAPIIDTNTIFQGRREIWIEHAGVRYRLRITRKNRLILQK